MSWGGGHIQSQKGANAKKSGGGGKREILESSSLRIVHCHIRRSSPQAQGGKKTPTGWEKRFLRVKEGPRKKRSSLV